MMKKILLPVLLAAMLAACSSKGTTTDDAAAAGAGGDMTGGSGVATVTSPGATGSGVSALTDPNSILSRRSVYFDFDQYVVRSEFHDLVAAHAQFLQGNPNMRILLQGNTDPRGSREYNLALGQRRAEAVRRALGSLGVSDAQVEAVSLGEEKPRCVEASENCYAENRRADILYSGEF